ncbi:MAG TPA: hypothetical protein VNX68_08355 [Nitrosopumilaceae archaeon]|jgi:hypothetical protein|nr:hypothetical protein [Nitrosopumilaceae archaeon]
MDSRFKFSFEALKGYYKKALAKGYEIVTCEDYVKRKSELQHKNVLVNRVDIDLSCKKVREQVKIFNELGIKGTLFFRLHGDEYNPFSFENYKIIKQIAEDGHEIGYHSEIVDQAAIWNEDTENCLKRDIAIFEKMFNVKISGVASHGGATGLNNLDFWKNRKPEEFGLLYEAYDHEKKFNLFQEAFYISDSNYRWKSYNKGVANPSSDKTFGDFLEEGHPLIYACTHPETYYYEHIYE